MAEAMQHYRSKTQRQRYLNVSAYKEFKEAIWVSSLRMQHKVVNFSQTDRLSSIF